MDKDNLKTPGTSKSVTVTSCDNGLIALNNVHSIAATLWTEKIPVAQSQNSRQNPRFAGKSSQQRRITPVKLPFRDPGANFNEDQKFSSGPRQFQNPQFEQSREENGGDRQGTRNHQVQTHQGSRAQGGRNNQPQERFGSDPNKKRAQIKSLPLKPPDIQNIDLFPPIGTAPVPRTASPAATEVKSKGNQGNPFATTAEESKFDPKYERKKIFTGVQKVQTQITTSTSPEVVPLQPLTQELIPRIIKRPILASSSSKVDTPPSGEEKGRSAELFAQLNPEQIQELRQLSSSFSNSLDANLCRSILAEFTFLCQLLVANNDEAVTSVSSGQATILATLAPRVWFVTRVFECQLPLISSISPDIVQMLIDFYPHRIPKQLRKKFELIIQKKSETETQLRLQSSPSKYSTCVIFQSETDGRSNFPNQRDCQDFGKQRDLFYAIREIWTSRQSEAQGGEGNGQYSTFDPGYPKVKQLFQTNSSPTNLSRLASLFLSQCVLDLNASAAGNDRYDPSSLQNVRRILQSNPSKYEKLRQRLLASDCDFDGNHPIPDPIDFLQYFINTSGSSQFTQHLIDHAIHEIRKMESEAGDFAVPEAVNLMRKSHLLAQILGFLYFLPYRDDEYKKPTGSINVEIYLRSQISLRNHQSFPLDLISILAKACAQKRLIFTLPWITELLSRADQVTFHLPAYKSILSFISCIYQELLPTSSESKDGILTEEIPAVLTPANKTLLRFMCGKLFGLPNFPDSFLFGNDGKHLTDFVQGVSSSSRLETVDEEFVPLNLEDSLGSSFLPIWFRPEMKQIITILSTNATVRGSIPAASPGIMKHIRPVPEKGPPSMEISTGVGGNLQMDLETQFFQIHPSSVKKTIDFISDRVSTNFLKQLRSKLLMEIRSELAQKRIFEKSGVVKCKEEVCKKLDAYSTHRCTEAVDILIGGTVSPPVGIICQKICVRNTRERVIDWVNQHVTRDLFPEIPDMYNLPPFASHPLAEDNNGTVDLTTWNPKAGSFFFILRSLHLTIQRLHKGSPIDHALIDRILDDPRLVKEKSWVAQRTLDLAMALLAFSPKTLTPERQAKFIAFWKQIWTEEFNSFLQPRNFVLLSMSRDLKLTYDTLSSLLKVLLKGKLITVTKIQENCMALLQHDWDKTTRVRVSKLLKDVLPDLEGTAEKEVIDWIAWYCSGQDGEEF